MERRRIAHTIVSPRVSVSTVFLGLDHSFRDGPPLLFESLVFGGKDNELMNRYATYDEAVTGHNRIVQRLLKTARKKSPIKHYIRKKLARPLEFYKEDTKSILKSRMRKVIKR